MTPAEVILRKSLVLQGEMNSADWEVMSAGIKDRAFWVSRCESLNFIDTCHKKIADLLSEAKGENGAITSRAEVVSAIMQAAKINGLNTGSASITNHGSVARASIIVDTNAAMAAGYASAIQSNSYGARLAFPAQELVRIEERERKRDWTRTWQQHGGHLYGGRMIALKGDPIWVKISRFGNPYPPFDFNSGMGVEDVSFDEAVSLGVIEDDYKPPEASPMDDFNDKIESSMTMSGPDDSKLLQLQKIFGDQIQYNSHTKRVAFDGAMVHDMASKIGREYRAGMKTTSVKAKPSIGHPAKMFLDTVSEANASSNLSISPSNIFHVFQDHVDTDKDSRNVPLTERELSLIGHLWRRPERIIKGKKDRWLVVRRDAFSNNYVLVVSVEKNGGLSFHSFFKVKKGVEIEN